ncbi:hypothetical protein Acr_21g0004600 [Actinidia rufa]|uniref:Uncharacterized protein n=1 Tax=Actinidia rufa TaxID=165716 RepID=A0A7J0GGL1_9ERIC|nr:hypothetical protein Acr_21g0004600 [Actinidia rufa]
MNLHARIWAVNRAYIVQALLCCVSSIGISVNLCVSPGLRRDCWRGLHVAGVIPELGGEDPLAASPHALSWLDILSGMALNRAQMLVRDSEALAQFCVDHRISNDVVIERLGPNDDADWVEGEGNWMPIRTWFIYQAGLRFPLSKLLRTVLSLCGLTFMQISVNFVRTMLAVEALMQREELEFTAEDLLHVYCVVKPRKNLETQMLEGNHYLRLRKPNQPQTRLVTDSPDKDQYLNDFIWVSGHWEFPVGEPDLFSVPRHRGYVLDSIDASRGGVIDVRLRLGHPVLSPLQIRSPGSRLRSSLFDEVSDLFERTSTELLRLLEEIEGESSGSTKSSSFSWDIDLEDEGLDEEAEVEDGEEVDQILDIAIVEPREVVEHSYSHSGSSSSGSQGNKKIMAPKVRTLGKGQAPRIEPPMLPLAPDLSMPVLAEDQSIAPSSMANGKRKGKQPAEGNLSTKKRKRSSRFPLNHPAMVVSCPSNPTSYLPEPSDIRQLTFNEEPVDRTSSDEGQYQELTAAKARIGSRIGQAVDGDRA